MRATQKLCGLCGRVDNGAARCRDHPAPPAKARVQVNLADEIPVGEV